MPERGGPTARGRTTAKAAPRQAPAPRPPRGPRQDPPGHPPGAPPPSVSRRAAPGPPRTPSPRSVGPSALVSGRVDPLSGPGPDPECSPWAPDTPGAAPVPVRGVSLSGISAKCPGAPEVSECPSPSPFAFPPPCSWPKRPQEETRQHPSHCSAHPNQDSRGSPPRFRRRGRVKRPGAGPPAERGSRKSLGCTRRFASRLRGKNASPCLRVVTHRDWHNRPPPAASSSLGRGHLGFGPVSLSLHHRSINMGSIVVIT